MDSHCVVTWHRAGKLRAGALPAVRFSVPFASRPQLHTGALSSGRFNLQPLPLPV